MKRTRILVFGGISSLGLLAGGFATANATPATTPGGSFVGSTPSNGATGSTLKAMATITPAAANAAAIAAVPGTAGTPEVIYDHGYVVYRTLVTGTDGTITEVIVDAGNGAVLDHYSPAQWNGLFGSLSNDTAPATASPAATTAATTTAATATSTPATTPGGSFVGSIVWPGETGVTPQSLAGITQAAANTAAIAVVPGTAGQPEAIYDHGYVVYRTLVTGSNGTITEVIVDAGNGTVLDHYSPAQWNGLFGSLSSDTAPATVTPAATAATTTATTAASTPASTPGGRFVGTIVWPGQTGVTPQSLAVITPAAANTAAVAVVPGTAGQPEAIWDYGYVVYRTIVTGTDGTKTEVIVDAGNGNVLDHYSPPQWNGLFGDLSNDTDTVATPAATTAATTTSTTAASTPASVAGGSFVGSIAWPNNGASPQSLALISRTQANTDAVAAVPGTAGAPEAIYDHGYVVYRTIVTGSDGTKTEVIVDAGNGTVLDHYAAVWNGLFGSLSN